MATITPHPRPAFLWQALLIVLPVVTLAAVGFFSLRQDKILAEHEAAERAQTIADDLLPRLRAALSALGNPGQSSSRIFEIDDAGQLLFPPCAAPIPRPRPFELAKLTE